MSNPLRTPDDYELFVYMLTEQYPSERQSTVAFVRLGATLARVSGELRFDHDIRLVIRERMLSHLARRADVEVMPHTLRHTFAKNLVNSGMSLEKVAALMGHSNLNTTSIYTIPSALDLEHVVAQIGE
jgi:integrase